MLQDIYSTIYISNLAEDIIRDAEAEVDEKEKYRKHKKEQEEITARLSGQENQTQRAKKFIRLVESCCNFEKVTPTAISEFISKIVVHERAVKRAKYAVQRIEVYFTDRLK